MGKVDWCVSSAPEVRCVKGCGLSGRNSPRLSTSDLEALEKSGASQQRDEGPREGVGSKIRET